MADFCEIDADGVVIRRMVGQSAEWYATRFGGTWVESTGFRAGPGWGYDPDAPARFAPPFTGSTFKPDQALYPGTSGLWGAGRTCFRNGRIWTCENPTPYDPDNSTGVDWSHPVANPTPTFKGLEQWDRGVDYAVGDIVEAHDTFWRALSDHRSKANDDDDLAGELSPVLWEPING